MLERIRAGGISVSGIRRTAFAGALVAAAILAACSTDNPLSLRPDVDIGTQTAALPGGGFQDLVPEQSASMEESPAMAEEPPMQSDPYMAAYPQPDMPGVLPGEEYQPDYMPEPQPPAMSQAEVDCRGALERLGVAYTDLEPINDGGACRIDHPVKVSAVGSVKIKPAATLNCQMALTFATWTRKELVPAARKRYWSGVKTIHQASSYSCRNIRRSGGVASEHSKGNAIDIGKIELNSGRDIEVEKQGLFAFRSRGFLNSVRSDGCDYFSTVLGPGYDYDHRNHFHFDIKARKNGYRACR